MQFDRHGEDARDRPLDMRAHGERGRVDIYDATRWHSDLPVSEVRLPYDLDPGWLKNMMTGVTDGAPENR
ncbi:hypothetical protein Pflav_054860 [Phytohabitans flavus]|uniref:Uncharacterized protein n=1 Tax=Phytohabitans flavus TaxID=1076124 RepID=A0A6F8XZ00_9ACTN|nr:hypothetical protein Pflav_054860 [Phytohabitans flavus]